MPARLAPSGVLALANGGTGAATQAAARTALGLGGAAVLNVGTVAGTVMDGADSRVTGAQQASGKGVANGYAGLDGNALVPSAQLPTDPSRAAANNPTITNTLTLAAANTANAQARSIFSNPAAGTDAKLADSYTDGSGIVFRFLNDAVNNATNWLTVLRNGYAATSITLAAASINLNGTLGLSAPLLVSQGGTGAATAAAARTALGAAASTTPAIAGAPVITVGSDLVGQRFVTGNFGVVDYYDGSNWYFLVTTSGNQLTTTYSGIRPLHINLTSGLVSMDSGAAVTGGLAADTLAVGAPPTFPTAAFGASTTAGATTGFVQAALATLDGGTF